MRMFHCLACLAALFCLTGRAAAQDVGDLLLEGLLTRQPAFLNLKELEKEPADSELQQLLKQRHNAVLIALDARYKEWIAGRGTLGFLLRDGEFLRKSRLELCGSLKEKLVVHQQYLDWTRDVERLTQVRYNLGRVNISDWKETQYHLLDAEIELLLFQRQANSR
jgi:hypothetical protein